MANLSSPQNPALSLGQISRREAIRLAIMITWVSVFVVASQVGRRTGLHIPGHRTAFWVTPLLLGCWVTGRRREAGLVGAMGGLFTSGLDGSMNCLFSALGLGLAGWFAGYISAPSQTWRGLLKSLWIGAVCGMLALGAKSIVPHLGSSRFLLALITYPLFGLVGGCAAWLLWFGFDKLAVVLRLRKPDSDPNASAFTLIELLIVVAIIGILAGIAIPNFLNAQVRAKVSRTQADLESLASALELYRVDNANYPPQGPSTPGSLDRLVVLSTPIQYISEGHKADPFSQTKTGDFYYRYSNYTKGQAGNNTPAAADPLRWGLRGRAPDGVLEKTQDVLTSNGTVAPKSLYDPTNGISSKGDLMRTGARATENQ